MRKTFALTIITIILAGLLMVPLGGNVSENFVPTSDNAPFAISGDGDLSSESITSFSETTADDVMFYPDGVFESSIVFASSSLYHASIQSGSLGNTEAKDGAAYVIAGSGTTWVSFNFTIPANIVIEGGFTTHIYAKSYDVPISANIEIYDWTNNVWDDTGSGHTNSYAWYNETTSDPDHWTDTQVAVRVYDSQPTWVYTDYIDVIFEYMTLADSDHYAESFADVSDCTTSDTSISTDGDLATITENGAGSTGRAYASFSSTDYFEYYYEFRIDSMTATTADLEFWDGAAYNTLKTFTAAGTYNGIISDVDAATMQRIGFLVGSEGGNIKPDYLRVGNNTSMGWQHDGSTTAGVTHESNDWSWITSSDGDKLTVTGNRSSSSDAYSWFDIEFDTTTTATDIERDYYPFFALKCELTAHQGTYTGAHVFTDGYASDGIGEGFHKVWDYSTFSERTEYLNSKALSWATDSNDGIRFHLYTDGTNQGYTYVIDWAKAFSIANFTYTGSGVGTDDYLYVDSGVLYSSIDDGYIELNHDPALSVSDTYSIYNLTTSGTAPEFSQYVSEWSTYSDDTRGATTSGTVTDIKLKFDSIETISAIKFIEDGTAPDILDKFVNPLDPDDDEGVTFTAVTYDAVEVYKVTLNAVVYPAGFSDVDYEMTEQTTDVLWSYEFSTLLAGYYLFEVEANDGANTYSEYIPVTIRESTITVEEITLIGAGSDFTMMQFSARINKDCSYVIYEESENNAEAATHSGSVSEPSFNLAWTKLDTTDTNVNFTIKFTNDTLTYNYTSQYQVAQTALSVTSYDWGFSETNIAISFQTSKGGTYTVYLDDVQDSTGSFVTGSNFLTWIRPSATDPAEIDAGVKLTDGTTTIWLNQTYSEFSETAFSVATLIIDKSGPDITAFATTTWLNGTLYLYQNDVQQDTGAEGITLSYAKSTAAGTYNVALKIDCGGEIAWWNDTYTIAAATLDITPISFFGVGEDFTQMSISFECSLSGSWSIVEWVQADGSDAAETHTGSVTVGWNNIAWTKLDTTADIVYFNMTVTSGALSETIPGLYGVAQLVLVITARPLSLANDEIIFSGQANKIGTWTLYLDDVQESTDSFLDSSFVINWTRAQSVALEKVAFALKFVNSTDTVWINGTYDKYSLVALTLATFDLDWFQNNITSLHLTTSWGNTSIDVWLNGSLVINGRAEGLFNFTRSSNEGYFNVTIVIDGGADTITYKAWVYFTTEGVTYEGDTTYNSAYSSYRNVYEGPVTIVDPDTVIIEGAVSFDDDKEEELAEAQWNTLRLIIEVISFPIIMAIAFYMGKARRQGKPRDRTSDVFRDVG